MKWYFKIALVCKELKDPLNGKVHATGSNLYDSAYYTCAEGYKLLGLVQRHCTHTGHWSEKEPICGKYHTLQYCNFY